MNKLRFGKDEGTAFYKDLTTLLDNYFHDAGTHKYGNRLMHIKIGMYFGLVALFYSCIYATSTLPAFYCIYLLLGIAVLLTAFNISHDAAHGVAVKSKFWNKVLFQASFRLQGNNAYVWGRNHNESHHLYTNIEGSDIDVLNNPLVRMIDTQPLRWYHRYQHLYCPLLYLLYSLNWFLFRETLMLFRYSSRTITVKMPNREVVKLVFFKLFYIGYMIVMPTLFTPFGWKHVLLAFLLNHFVISIIFVGVLGVSHLSDYVHHPHPDDENRLPLSWPKLQMQTSIDYNAGSAFLNWTLADLTHMHYITCYLISAMCII